MSLKRVCDWCGWDIGDEYYCVSTFKVSTQAVLNPALNRYEVCDNCFNLVNGFIEECKNLDTSKFIEEMER